MDLPQVDDDTFINRRRLEMVLSKFNPNVPTLIGHINNAGFCHGGAGYIFSKALLRAVGPYLFHCRAKKQGSAAKWEDLYMKWCILDIMTLGGTGWKPCTSGVELGFDTALVNVLNKIGNSKNQTSNQYVNGRYSTINVLDPCLSTGHPTSLALKHCKRHHLSSVSLPLMVSHANLHILNLQDAAGSHGGQAARTADEAVNLPQHTLQAGN